MVSCNKFDYYIMENQRRFWNRVSPFYDALYASPWSRNEDNETGRWLAQAINGRSFVRILDIGCGTGLGYRLVKQCSDDFEYVGVDISEGMIDQFKAQLTPSDANKVTLHVSDAQLLRTILARQSFDFVLMTNAAASYTGSPTRLLGTIDFVLRDGGFAFVSFLNRSSLRRCLRGRTGVAESFQTRGLEGCIEGVRVLTITEAELRARCARRGLSVIWVRYQSALGGVAESDLLQPAERAFMLVAPRLGHLINVLARRG
jgi:SAM-dependent methyltransferase